MIAKSQSNQLQDNDYLIRERVAMVILEVEKEMFQTRDGRVDLKRQMQTRVNDSLSSTKKYGYAGTGEIKSEAPEMIPNTNYTHKPI